MKQYLLFLSIIFFIEDANAQDKVFLKAPVSKESTAPSLSYGNERNINLYAGYYSSPFMQRKGLYGIKKSLQETANLQTTTNQLAKHSEFFSKFYLKPYIGYGIFSPGSYRVQSINLISYFDQDNRYHDTSFQTQSAKGIGGGLRFGGGIGYVLNDFLNMGIDVEFQKGVKLKNSLSTSLTPYNYNSTYDEIHYKAITITPHAIFKALAKPNYFIYNKLGILFTLPYSLHTSGNAVNSQGSSWPPVTAADSTSSTLSVRQTNYEGNYKISLGIGFNVAFGISMRLNSKFRMFGELFGNFSALNPKSSQVATKTDYKYSRYDLQYDYNTDPATVLGYTLGGFHQIGSSVENTRYQKGGVTKRTQDSYNYTYNGPDEPSSYDETISSQDKRFIVNMNALGINFGITYRF